jgi:hypothetical protein
MEIIDKSTREFVRATDAIVTRDMDDMTNPSDASVNQGIDGPKRRQRPEELTYFLKQNTLAIMERMHNIAMDALYYRDETGQRQRSLVPAGVQLQASIAFLDRALGKPQVAIDLTSGDRPIMFDASFSASPLIQRSHVPMVEDIVDSLDVVDILDPTDS